VQSQGLFYIEIYHDFKVRVGFKMSDVKLHGKGIRKDFRSKNIEIFCTERTR
jgi:hypothetical protein